MRRSYHVLWGADSTQLSEGRLELLPGSLRLEAPGATCEIRYADVNAIRVDGRHGLVVERVEGEPIRIEPALVGEIGEQLVAANLEEASFLPTPGPGDSDGGDIY
jgi:hypothetical protein